jgi:hypothetical protein
MTATIVPFPAQQSATISKCAHCGAETKDEQPLGWRWLVDEGAISGWRCPACQKAMNAIFKRVVNEMPVH